MAMALTDEAKILGIRCRRYLQRALRGDAPVKHLALILGQSRQTAARLYAGEVPTAVQLVALAGYFGRDFVADVFAPVVGDMTEAANGAVLARVETLISELRDQGEISGRANSSPPGPLGPPISIRLPLDEIRRYPRLATALQHYHARAGRAELAEAIALARADPLGLTNINRHTPGDLLRVVYGGRANRIHAPHVSVKDMPVMNVVDASYGDLIQRCADETERSGEPVLARHRGMIRRPDGVLIASDVIVLRTLDRAKDGTMIFSSHVQPGAPASI